MHGNADWKARRTTAAACSCSCSGWDRANAVNTRASCRQVPHFLQGMGAPSTRMRIEERHSSSLDVLEGMGATIQPGPNGSCIHVIQRVVPACTHEAYTGKKAQNPLGGLYCSEFRLAPQLGPCATTLVSARRWRVLPDGMTARPSPDNTTAWLARRNQRADFVWHVRQVFDSPEPPGRNAGDKAQAGMALRVGQVPSRAAADLRRIVRRTKVTQRLRGLLAQLWRRWRGTLRIPVIVISQSG